MMEVYVFFSLLGIGYIMSKSNKNEQFEYSEHSAEQDA